MYYKFALTIIYESSANQYKKVTCIHAFKDNSFSTENLIHTTNIFVLFMNKVNTGETKLSL